MKYYIKMWLIILFQVSINTCVIAQCPPDGGNQEGEHGSGGEDDSLDDFIEWLIRGVHSADPNDILGPAGYIEKRWVSINNKLAYRIRFENNPDFATAPAQNVFVYLPVHPGININSLRLSSFGFGNFTFHVPDNSTFYSTRLDVRDSLGLYVDFTAGIDITKNQLFWIFRSIDPVTGQPPTDPLVGFLPVNDTSINRFNDTLPKPGEGYVTFLISPKKTLLTGDTVSAKAVIIFDTNEEIPTNLWTNTIDAFAPTSKINMATVLHDTVTLNWTGQDDAGGSGVKEYAVYFSENNGPFLLYKNRIPGLSVNFVGTPGNRYCFFSVATDNTGNNEALKTGCEVSVSLTDASVPLTWLYFRGQKKNIDVELTWGTATESNTRSFIVERSFNARDFLRIGEVDAAGNSNQITRYQYIDREALKLNVPVLYYRLRQTDLDNNYSFSNIIAIPVNKDNNGLIVQVYPNPFRESINLLINNFISAGQQDKVELFTLDGRLLYRRNLTGIQNNSPVLLNDLPLLIQGTYLLKTYINGEIKTIKIVRQ